MFFSTIACVVTVLSNIRWNVEGKTIYDFLTRAPGGQCGNIQCAEKNTSDLH